MSWSEQSKFTLYFSSLHHQHLYIKIGIEEMGPVLSCKRSSCHIHTRIDTQCKHSTRRHWWSKKIIEAHQSTSSRNWTGMNWMVFVPYRCVLSSNTNLFKSLHSTICESSRGHTNILLVVSFISIIDQFIDVCTTFVFHNN